MNSSFAPQDPRTIGLMLNEEQELGNNGEPLEPEFRDDLYDTMKEEGYTNEHEEYDREMEREKSELEKGTMDEHDFDKEDLKTEAELQTERCYWCGNAIEGEPQLVSTSEDGGDDPVIIRVPVCEDCYTKLEEEK